MLTLRLRNLFLFSDFSFLTVSRNDLVMEYSQGRTKPITLTLVFVRPFSSFSSWSFRRRSVLRLRNLFLFSDFSSTTFRRNDHVMVCNQWRTKPITRTLVFVRPFSSRACSVLSNAVRILYYSHENQIKALKGRHNASMVRNEMKRHDSIRTSY